MDQGDKNTTDIPASILSEPQSDRAVMEVPVQEDSVSLSVSEASLP